MTINSIDNHKKWIKRCNFLSGNVMLFLYMCKFFLVMILQNLIILMIKTIDFSYFCLSLRNKTKNYEKFH